MTQTLLPALVLALMATGVAAQGVQPYAGQLYPAQGVQPYAGQLYPAQGVQPYPGQPYPAQGVQPYPGQPYPTQGAQPYPNRLPYPAQGAQPYPNRPPYPYPDQGQDDSNAHYGWADVLRVDPVYGNVRGAPHQECYNQPVGQMAVPPNHVAGTVLGVVVGGLLGNAMGRGGGRAAVAGAVVGGAVGNGVASANDGGYRVVATQCHTVVDTGPGQRRIVGYDVEYRYRGEVYVSRLSYDPGERLRVRFSVEPAE